MKNEPTHYVSDQIAEGPRKFRKKVVAIEAVQWTGDNFDELSAWSPVTLLPAGNNLIIGTLEDGPNCEALYVAYLHDWIIKGIAGEFYPCNPDIFAQTYEPAATRETRGTPPDAATIIAERDKWWVQIIQGAIGNWGGPQYKEFNDAMARIWREKELADKGLDSWGEPIEDDAPAVSQPVAPPPPPNEIEHLRRMVRLLCDDGVNLEYCRDLAKRTFQSPAAVPAGTQPAQEGWFNEDEIRRDGLPRDVFGLIHDLCYHHDGRDVSQYVMRAREILRKGVA